MVFQLKDIADRSEKLEQKYPGNSDAIDAEIKHLEKLWQKLVDYTNRKNDELQYSVDYLNLYDKVLLFRVMEMRSSFRF